jgi:homoserine kinase
VPAQGPDVPATSAPHAPAGAPEEPALSADAAAAPVAGTAPGDDAAPLPGAASGDDAVTSADEPVPPFEPRPSQPSLPPSLSSPFPGIVRSRVVVEVPATTANLGAGYDVLAMALDLVNRVTVEVLDEPLVELEVEGEGSGQLVGDRHNRFVVALELGLRWALGEVPAGIGWRVEMRNEIPLARGLGSSAAATVAGLVAADALTGGRLGERLQLDLACELEGHPDNAAAALLGGFVVVATVGGRPEAVRFDVPGRLRAVLFVPDRELATTAMRTVLPREVLHRDAVFNVGRAALAVAAISSGRYELLRDATEDRLHEPYRAAVFPELPRLVAAAREAGALGACLSGAGSSVIAFADDERTLEDAGLAMARVAAEQGLTGRVRPIVPRNAGPIVVEAH